MVGGTATEMPEQALTHTSATPTSTSTVTTTNDVFFIRIAKNCHQVVSQSHQHDSLQQLRDIESVNKMRAGWRRQKRNHSFHQKKWSTDKRRY